MDESNGGGEIFAAPAQRQSARPSTGQLGLSNMILKDVKMPTSNRSASAMAFNIVRFAEIVNSSFGICFAHHGFLTRGAW